jgi:hypothetical protein
MIETLSNIPRRKSKAPYRHSYVNSIVLTVFSPAEFVCAYPDAASLEGASEDDQNKAKVLMAVNASKSSGWCCAACFCAFGSNPAGIMKVAYSGPPYYRFYLICRKCAAAPDEKITDRVKAHL